MKTYPHPLSKHQESHYYMIIDIIWSPRIRHVGGQTQGERYAVSRTASAREPGGEVPRGTANLFALTHQGERYAVSRTASAQEPGAEALPHCARHNSGGASTLWLLEIRSDPFLGGARSAAPHVPLPGQRPQRRPLAQWAPSNVVEKGERVEKGVARSHPLPWWFGGGVGENT